MKRLFDLYLKPSLRKVNVSRYLKKNGESKEI